MCCVRPSLHFVHVGENPGAHGARYFERGWAHAMRRTRTRRARAGDGEKRSGLPLWGGHSVSACFGWALNRWKSEAGRSSVKQNRRRRQAVTRHLNDEQLQPPLNTAPLVVWIVVVCARAKRLHPLVCTPRAWRCGQAAMQDKGEQGPIRRAAPRIGRAAPPADPGPVGLQARPI